MTEEDTFNQLVYGTCDGWIESKDSKSQPVRCKNPGTADHLCGENNCGDSSLMCNCCASCHTLCGPYDPSFKHPDFI